jgi:hypothetical protein
MERERGRRRGRRSRREDYTCRKEKKKEEWHWRG